MKHIYMLLVLVMSTNIGSLFAQNEELSYVFHFETAKSQLPQETQKAIRAIANQAQKWVEHSIIIQGHTDNIGNEKYNIKLSRSRAEEVKKLFIKAGIDNRRIIIKALGEEYPLVSNQYEEGRKTNRRVEIALTQDIAINYGEQQKRNQQVLKKLRSKVPKFILNQADAERYLTTKQGTQIHIPEDAFDVPKGTVVELKVVEAYKKSDMILYGLTTMSNGKQLITGGMVKVEAMANGVPIQLKSGKYLEVNVPSKNPDQRMQLFYADASAQTINWVNPRPLAVNRPKKTGQEGFYQEFLLTRIDSRSYSRNNNLSPEQIQRLTQKLYVNKADSSNLYKDFVEPIAPEPIDSSRVKFWEGVLPRVERKINAPCNTFACKWKTFFRSKKRKAELQQKDENRLANIKRNISVHKQGLARQIKKHRQYREAVKIINAQKDSLKNDYLVKVQRCDSINFEYACFNHDIEYIHTQYKNREKEAYQKLYGVTTFEAAQNSKKEVLMEGYVNYYLPKGDTFNSTELKQFLIDYPTIKAIEKKFIEFACEKKDTNYILWRRGKAMLERSLPIMYKVNTLEEARKAQTRERIEAKEAFYAAKMEEYGVSTIEEAYRIYQANIDAERRAKLAKKYAERQAKLAKKVAWEQQVGYVFEMANLGNWINCDYFPGRTQGRLITQNFDLPIVPNKATTYLIFKDIASVMRGYANYSSLKNWYTFRNIPENKAIQVVSFYRDKEGQTYVAAKSLLATEAIEKLEYKPMSMEAFKKVLTDLDV